MTFKRPELKPMERSVFGRMSQLLFAAMDRLHRAWLSWAHLNQRKPWFPIMVGLVVAIDAVIVVLPGDVLVALAVLSNPAAWRKLAVYAGLGGAIGAFCLYMLLFQFGKAPLDRLAELGAPAGVEHLNDLNASQPDVEAGLAAVTQHKPPKWERARDFFNRFGLFSLALGSLIPLFSWPPVVLAGLSTNRWWEVLFWLLIGRQARYWLACFGLREGWAMFQALREEAQTHREALLPKANPARRKAPKRR